MTVVRFDEDGRSILETIEMIRQDAEAGNITCLIIVAARQDGTTGRAFCPGLGVMSVLGELRVAEEAVLDHLREINDGSLL